MKHDQQSFMELLFAGTNFKVINGSALLKLSNGNTVKLVPTTTHVPGTIGEYNGLLLTIVNSKDGQIDQSKFRFSDIMINAASTHPNASLDNELRIVEHCGWEWFIDRPTERSISRYVCNILAYLEFFE